jgi:Uma2 family endonuclease
MTTLTPHHRYTFEEYLALEEASSTRHGFYDGAIYAMAGGTPEHAALTMRFGALLLEQLGARCRVYSSDLRVRVEETGLTTYPDVTVVCGQVETAAGNPSVVVNPTLIVEVLNESTEAYDRGTKLDHYAQIVSLRAVLLVAQDVRRVTLHRRDEAGGWQTSERGAGEQIDLDDPALRLDVDRAYSLAGL